VSVSFFTVVIYQYMIAFCGFEVVSDLI